MSGHVFFQHHPYNIIRITTIVHNSIYIIRLKLC